MISLRADGVASRWSRATRGETGEGSGRVARLYQDGADVEVGAHRFFAALRGDHARAEGDEGLDGRARPQQPRLRQRQRRRIVRRRRAILEPARDAVSGPQAFPELPPLDF